MTPDDRKRNIASQVARAVGQELVADCGNRFVEIAVYGEGSLQSADIVGLKQAGEDLIAKYVARGIQMDREGRVA